MSQISSENPNDIVELDLTGRENAMDELCRIDQLTNLQILVLERCLTLTDLPQAFSNLSSLHSLNLKGCTNLKHLPSGFGSLSSLRNLDLSFCDSLLHLPPTFGNLTSLQTLNLEFCQDLPNLPQNFSNLGSLEILQLSGCESLEKLPDEFGNLKSLRHLGFRQDRSLASGMETLPERFGKLYCLQELTLRCPNLEILPESFGDLQNLIYLDLSGCDALSSFPDSFGNLESLQFLSIQFCSGLESVWSDSSSLSSLMAVNAADCNLKEDAMEKFLEVKGLILLYIAGSKGLIDRWEKVKDQHLLWLICERRTPELDSFEWEAFQSAARVAKSRCFFHSSCNFVDAEGNFAEDLFPGVGAKLALVICANSDVASSSLELMKEKCAELASRDFEVVYVILSEESQEDCRQKLGCLLPEGGGWCWIAGEQKCRNLFGFSVVYGETSKVDKLDAFIATANVVADEKGNKCLDELELVISQGGDNHNGACFETIYHPLNELISRMMEA